MEEKGYISSNADIYISDNATPQEIREVLGQIKRMLPDEFWDDEIDKMLHEILAQCAMITVEYPYFGSDYLSVFYEFYAKQFRPHRKECCRIIFFNKYNKSCVGYITLRPLTGNNKVGKTYLNPSYFLDSNTYVICGKYKIHYEGDEALIRAMPYMQQDGIVAVCAHVCLWEAVRFYSSRFSHFQDYTIGKIANDVNVRYERKIPSKGLTVRQMSTLLVDAGYSCVILERDRDEGKKQIGAAIDDEIIAYIESGVPVICVGEGHAVLACGIQRNMKVLDSIHDLKDRTVVFSDGKDDITTNVLFDTDLVRNIVVNDDVQSHPYSIIGKGSAPKGICNEQNPISRMGYIEYGIVPLYRRIYLPYADARNVALTLYTKGRSYNGDMYSWQQDGLGVYRVMKLFIASANSFQEHIRSQVDGAERRLSQSFLELLKIAYSRLVWVVEIASVEEYKQGECSSFILLDSTCAITDPHICIAIADANHCEFHAIDYSDKEHYPVIKQYTFEYTENPLKMKAFSKNLRKGGVENAESEDAS